MTNSGFGKSRAAHTYIIEHPSAARAKLNARFGENVIIAVRGAAYVIKTSDNRK